MAHYGATSYRLHSLCNNCFRVFNCAAAPARCQTMHKLNFKTIAQMATLLAILPIFLAYKCLSIIDKNSAFASCSQFLSLFPGKLGSYFRNSFFHLTMTRCEQGVVIAFGTLFSQADTEISAGTYIGPQCNIGTCEIGKDCLFGSGVHILSGKNQHTIDSTEVPIREQGGSLTKIRIGEDTWIGNGAIVMADVGKKCVVAAGSVVVHEVGDHQIVAGNPAKVVKVR